MELKTLKQAKIDHIRQTLEHFRGNKTATAEALGISRDALYYNLDKYGIKLDSLENDEFLELYAKWKKQNPWERHDFRVFMEWMNRNLDDANNRSERA